MRYITIIITTTTETKTMEALASSINEVRRDLDNDPDVIRWHVEC